MIDYEEAMKDYIQCYGDKSRIIFIEKYLYTFNATKGKKTPFKLFPRQRVFLETLATNRNVISIKPRQCGITTLTSAWATAQCAFADADSPETILCIGNKLDLAQQLITKIRDFLVQVPRWYWGDEYYSPNPKDEANRRSIFVKDSKSELELFNGCRVVARSSGENAARGISAVSILILDEAAFIENGVAVYSTAAATMASNPNSKTVMVSTPNGKDALYFETYSQALAGENNFVPVQFRWYQDPRYNKYLKWYKKNATTGNLDWIVEETLDDEGTIHYDEDKWEKLVQKGWTPTSIWYEEMCRSFNNDRIKIAQELDVSFVGSSDNVIEPKYIEMQEKLNKREPLDDMRDPLVEETWFFKKPIDGHRYICSCLPPKEKVLTDRGVINVEEVMPDDMLVTREGEYTPIKEIKYRDVVKEEVIKIQLYGCTTPIRFTWNHPVWFSKGITKKTELIDLPGGVGKANMVYTTREFKYGKAKEITADESWVEIPNVYASKVLSDDEMNEYWKAIAPEYVPSVLTEKNFWHYCGKWLAEKAKYYERDVNPTLDFMHKYFINPQHGKVLPEWVKFISEKYKLCLVEGFLYGYISKDRDYLDATVNSKYVIDGIQEILYSCGIISDVTFIGKEPKTNFKLYSLKMSKPQYAEFLKKLGKEPWFTVDPIENRKENAYFSDDRKYIRIRVKSVSSYIYTGKVYNFETVSQSHSYCCSRIACHNCDPSRGSSEDFTAIEVIDMDGRDENGMPIIEQVMQYYGKKLGNEVGEILYNYATIYNNAFVVVDATNGLGDVPLFVLLAKGYKNLYYDDAALKKYSMQFPSKPASYDKVDVLPGFHMQGNRYPVLSNFANMVRNNEFKIRSMRTINELNTWIFKGEAKRMDHMDGKHDDSITCLAMGLFVMRFSLSKQEEAQNKDKAILSAYMTGGKIATVRHKELTNGKTMDTIGKRPLPIYNERALKSKKFDNINGSYLWMLSGYI